jgi:hypothetical protein
MYQIAPDWYQQAQELARLWYGYVGRPEPMQVSQR